MRTEFNAGRLPDIVKLLLRFAAALAELTIVLTAAVLADPGVRRVHRLLLIILLLNRFCNEEAKRLLCIGADDRGFRRLASGQTGKRQTGQADDAERDEEADDVENRGKCAVGISFCPDDDLVDDVVHTVDDESDHTVQKRQIKRFKCANLARRISLRSNCPDGNAENGKRNDCGETAGRDQNEQKRDRDQCFVDFFHDPCLHV